MSRRYYYTVHLEPKSHAKSKKRREQEKFKSRYNESSKVYRFIETVAKKTSIERIKGEKILNGEEKPIIMHAFCLSISFHSEWALLMMRTLSTGNPSPASHLGERS